MAWSDDRYTAARVAKLRAERAAARDALTGTGHVAKRAALQRDIDRDIRRALVGDSHDTKRTSALPSTVRTESVAPASRGLDGVLPGQVTTQGSPASLAHERKERKAAAHDARMARKAAREARRLANRGAR